MYLKIKPYLIAIALLSLSIGWRAPHATVEQGVRAPVNMTLHEDLLLVSDSQAGVHVFDVTDPANPARQLTIPLQGNHGSAMRDDIVYANEWNSLLAIRVTEDTYEVVKTIAGPEPVYFDGWSGRDGYKGEAGTGFGCACSVESTPVMSPEAASGGGGSSYATFTVIGDYLYYLDQNQVVSLDISTPDDPVEISRTYVAWGAETLYPSESYLFVGGTTGMYILNRADPAHPKQIGWIQHFRACDPVVVSDNIAFVTLRGDNRCGPADDILMAVDVTNPSKPRVLCEKPSQTPYGLAVNGDRLYLSTGFNGYELLDVTSPDKPTLIGSWGDTTRDFIWFGNRLYVMTFGDVAVYDVSDPEDPQLLSRFE